MIPKIAPPPAKNSGMSKVFLHFIVQVEGYLDYVIYPVCIPLAKILAGRNTFWPKGYIHVISQEGSTKPRTPESEIPWKYTTSTFSAPVTGLVNFALVYPDAFFAYVGWYYPTFFLAQNNVCI